MHEPTEEELEKKKIYNKALARLKEYTDANGYEFFIPSESASTVSKTHVLFRDGERYMCKYDIKKKQLIFKNGTTY